MSPSGAGRECPIPVPPPPPPRQGVKPWSWSDSEQSQKSTQLGGSQHRTQACKLLAGWWRQGKFSREFQHWKHRDHNRKSQQCRIRLSRGHSREMTSWSDWRPGTVWSRDEDRFTQQLAEQQCLETRGSQGASRTQEQPGGLFSCVPGCFPSFRDQQKHALKMVLTLPCYNSDESVRTHWCEHVSKSNRPVYEATRVQQALLRLQAQGYATIETGQDEVLNSGEDLLDAREDDASSGEKENGQLRRQRTPSDASTEYASRRSSTRSEEEHLPDEASRAISPDAVDQSENLCVEHGFAQESLYERRRRERHRPRHGMSHRKEIVAAKRSDLRMDHVLDTLRELTGPDNKIGLLLGWLLGRFLSVVLSHLAQPVWKMTALEVSEAFSTPMHWMGACLLAVWLGSMAVNRMGSHPSWQLGCLAAWAFALIG